MKYQALLSALCALTPTVAAAVTPGSQAILQDDKQQAPLDSAEEQYLIELAPGMRQWVTEEQKWELRRNGQMFMDVTDTPDIGMMPKPQLTVKYPEHPKHNATVGPLLDKISQKHMRKNLEKLTSFHTRYYKSSYGAESSAWLLGRVNDTVAASGALEHGAHVRPFKHPWGQHSIIATIPGRSNKTVVVGAHQDSINLFLPAFLAAPGADDDGSGTVTILESLRVLLSAPNVAAGNADNTIEFHWYSAEEGGLLGSAAIFAQYEKEGRDVRAMLQQDMTGYTQRTIDAGKPESVGVITDYVSAPLTAFIKKIIGTYCDVPYVETKCGYACSDHASASKAGFPSAFVIESEFKLSDPKIHTTEDKIEYLDFGHMAQHAKMTIGLAYELAFADLE